jgi:hypothetical protein
MRRPSPGLDRQGSIGSLGVQKRRNDGGPSLQGRLRDREFNLSSTGAGIFRPQQRDRAGHKRCRDAGSAEGEGLAFGAEACDAGAERAQASPTDRTAAASAALFSASRAVSSAICSSLS